MNIEEKAKRYAQSVVDESVENYIGDEVYNSHIEYASQCYTAGYTQAVTDLSAENEKLKFESQNYADLFRASQEVVNQYKEALRETSKELEQVFLDWYPYDDETEIFRIGAIVDKAKQLIENRQGKNNKSDK